jgi:hypothetical protein
MATPATTGHRAALQRAVGDLSARTNDPKPETLLKQYELLRAEVTTSLQLQQQALSFGIATLGVLAGVAFVADEERFRGDVLVVFLPLIAYLALIVWFSEVMRMLRAGAFLMTLEKQLDDLGDGSLVWEKTVAQGRLKHPMWKPYFGLLDPDQLRLLSVTALFFVMALASILLGWDATSGVKQTFAVAAGVLSVIVVAMLYQLRIEQLEDLIGVPEEFRLGGRLRRQARRFSSTVRAAPQRLRQQRAEWRRRGGRPR